MLQSEFSGDGPTPTSLSMNVGQHAIEPDAEPAQFGAEVVDEAGGDLGALVPDHELDDGPAGRDVDRGELPDRAHALELARSLPM